MEFPFPTLCALSQAVAFAYNYLNPNLGSRINKKECPALVHWDTHGVGKCKSSSKELTETPDIWVLLQEVGTVPLLESPLPREDMIEINKTERLTWKCQH